MANLDKMGVKCRNATNCSLERYNRAVNELFPNKHPNLLQFAASILEETKDWTKYLLHAAFTPEIITKEYDTAKVQSFPKKYKTYKQKNDKTASPLRKFNKEKNAQHNKAAFKRMVDDPSTDSGSSN